MSSTSEGSCTSDVDRNSNGWLTIIFGMIIENRPSTIDSKIEKKEKDAKDGCSSTRTCVHRDTSEYIIRKKGK